MNKQAYYEGYVEIAQAYGVDPLELEKRSYEGMGTTALPWEERIQRGFATLPVVSALGGADYNIQGARDRFEELGLDEERLSWPTKNPTTAALLGTGIGGLAGAGLGGLWGLSQAADEQVRARALGEPAKPWSMLPVGIGAGVGGLTGALLGSSLPAGAAYEDLARAENLAMQEMRREQMAERRTRKR
jgi:hypothetical protein